MTHDARDLDLAAPLARLRGDETLLLEMAGFFAEDYPALLETVREKLKAGDLAAVERAAHSLKGLAATFDAEPTIAAAADVEAAARDKQSDRLPRLVETLDAKARWLAERLADYRRSCS